MGQQVTLKTTMFGGFEKKSVLNYIYELNASTKEAQEKLDAQLEEVTASREKLSETIKDLEARMDGLQKERDTAAKERDDATRERDDAAGKLNSVALERDSAVQRLDSAVQERDTAKSALEGEKSKTRELNELIESLGKELDRQKKIVADKDAEIDEYIRQNAQLKKEQQNLINVQAAAPQPQIPPQPPVQQPLMGQPTGDAVTAAKLGELLIRTQAQSDQILADARRRADDLVAGAAGSLGDLTSRFNTLRREIDDIQSQLQGTVGVMQQRFAGITDALNRTEQVLQSVAKPSTTLQYQREDDATNTFSAFFR